MIGDNTKTLCRFAWDYPVVHLNMPSIRNCCRALPTTVTSELLKQGPSLFSRAPDLVATRRDLLRGVQAPACKSCWKLEDAGNRSPRSGFGSFVDFLAEHKWFGTQNKIEIGKRLQSLTQSEIDKLAIFLDKPRMVEVSLSNLCDMKCVYCSHDYSSQWVAERLKFKEITIEQAPNDKPNSELTRLFWEYFSTHAYKTASYINFIGGEPLLIDDFYVFVDKLIALYKEKEHESLPPYVILSVVTNLNCSPKIFSRFVSMIPKILANPRLHLHVSVSMESVGPRAEFIRHGTNWERVKDNQYNLGTALKTYWTPTDSRVHYGLQIALNSLCVSDFEAFTQHVVGTMRRLEMPLRLSPNQVVYPTWLAPNVLPPEYAIYLEKGYKVLEEELNDSWSVLDDPLKHVWSSYLVFLRNICAGIRNPQKDLAALSHFRPEIQKLEKRRGLNFLSTFPEMKDFYDRCVTPDPA